MADKETYPNLTGAEARKRIAEDRAAQERFDKREAARLRSQRGIEKHNERKQAERRRVRAQIMRDRAERKAEAARQASLIRLGKENTLRVSLADIALGPTDEQIRQAGKNGYERVAEVGTGKDARSGAIVWRRRECPVAYKMMMQGVIDRHGFDACCWYRGIYETTGLSGNIPSIDYGREVFAASHSRAMFTDWQAQNQDMFRAIRREIPSRFLRMLDAMVLQDVSVHRAARVARTGHRDPKGCFEKAVVALVETRQKLEGRS